MDDIKEATRISTGSNVSQTKLKDAAHEFDRLTLSPSLHGHKDYRCRLLNLEPDLKHFQEKLHSLAMNTPPNESERSLGNLFELSKEMNAQSNFHSDRLKLLDEALHGKEINGQGISDLGKGFTRRKTPSNKESFVSEVTEQLSAFSTPISASEKGNLNLLGSPRIIDGNKIYSKKPARREFTAIVPDTAGNRLT